MMYEDMTYFAILLVTYPNSLATDAFQNNRQSYRISIIISFQVGYLWPILDTQIKSWTSLKSCLEQIKRFPWQIDWGPTNSKRSTEFPGLPLLSWKNQKLGPSFGQFWPFFNGCSSGTNVVGVVMVDHIHNSCRVDFTRSSNSVHN